MGQGIPAGWVRLINHDAKFDATLLLGADPPQITDTVGGWETVSRPRQIGMTIWQGSNPSQLTITVMLDGLIGQVSQEPTIRALIAAGRGDDETEPSTWQIQGLPAANNITDEWVLNAVEPGDSILRRTNDFSRIRQNYTLTFLEYIPPEYVQIRAKALQGAKSKTTLYTTKKGDTPASIARKRRCKWTQIRDLNKKIVTHGANQKLKAGTRLRVPVLKASKKKTAVAGKKK